MKMRYLLIVIAILFVAGALINSSYARLDPKTVAGIWLFNDNKGNTAVDSSENKNDGTIKGNPKWENGKFGKCLESDGSVSVDCGNGESLDITKEITVMAWMNFNALDYKNSAGKLNTIAAKGYPDAVAAHAGWWFSYDNRNNAQDFPYSCFGNKNGGWVGGGNSLGGNPLMFANGDWNHFAFTVSSKSVAKLYINGTQHGADKTFANLVLSDTNQNLLIGATVNGFNFFGLIDDVAIFNVALSAEDIKNIMDSGLEESLSSNAVSPSGKLPIMWGSIKN